MSTAAAAIATGLRSPPRRSQVIGEEVRITLSRMTQGRPYVGALVLVAVIWFFRDTAVFPVILGMMFPLYAWQDRMMGQATLWERPTSRRTANTIRHLTGFAYLLGVLALMMVLDVSAGTLGVPDSAEPVRTTTLTGGAILAFTLISIMGQFLNERRKYLLPMVAMLGMPLIALPSRIYLRMLPDSLHPLLIGRYGLDVFGRGFFATTPGVSVLDWSRAAALWIPCCLLAIVTVSSIHNE